MIKLFFSFFLIIHILGFFYFQSDRRSGKYTYIVRNSFIYLLISLFFLIPFYSSPLLISVFLLSILHFVIESVNYLCKKRQTASLFVTEQLIYLGFISIVASILIYLDYRLELLPPFNTFLSKITINPDHLLTWIGLLLIAIKPANVTIKQLLAKYKPDHEESVSYNQIKAGALIGTLERIIILLLISVGQYSAIGLVLTAKSVARYNKISEDKAFAEYYLIGSLFSTLYAIGAYFIFI
ncbi:DUF3307 domain-containing protein [Sporolactobacillus shoreicorticis]|uniref:DUF3307 domain-containing protein n=1 Tax=Sporolactobacillus shoreicorticis TaxID=1923877 RepID=A0ABW5S4A1_9BACL|nr:DUF3307 domain-containing protein [Sporolactobacillus shoreicorticis]MCO7124499.1 DUF3307 domain-containing protein [Sporolactobacillus shoreicorticis]